MISRISRLFRRDQEEAECVQVRNLSSDYIDGELDPATLDKVNSHLEWCGSCQSFFNTLRVTIGLLGSFRKPEVPASYRERLRERLRTDRGQ